MKKIINGKKYDTDTATFICSYVFSNRMDFHFYRKALYQKKTGEFFFYREGGPLSCMAKSYGNNNVGGSDEFIPNVSKDEAIKFCEENMNVDDFEKKFGAVEE